MREIKFRGKSKYNGEWVYAEIHGFGMDLFGESVDEETICQYTGLKDKHGNEIYEHDVISVFDGEKCFKIFVRWSVDAMSFIACYVDGNKSPLSWFSNIITRKYEIEVIGNIFDDKLLID